MVSLADRRGRSALSNYAVISSPIISAHRLHSAPPVSKPQPATLRHVTDLVRPDADNINVLPDDLQHHIQIYTDLFNQLRQAINDLIADDPEWLEEQYGLGPLVQGVHDTHRVLVGRCADLYDQLVACRRQSEQSVVEHDRQQRQLESLDLSSWTTPEQLQQTIDTLEAELLRLDPGRSLAVPAHLHGLGSVPRLIALRFQRQDDLLYVLRRRLCQISYDQPLSECLKEFRSLDALINEFHRLRQQNAQLQLRERRFQQSVLLRRRSLQQCSSHTLHCLVIALQNELSAVHDIVSELEPYHHHPLYDIISPSHTTSLINIDQLCIDQSPISNHNLDLHLINTSLQHLHTAIQTAEFVSESAGWAANDAIAALQAQMQIVERTVTDQYDLVRDGAERLRDQRMLNVKLTSLVQDLLQKRPDGETVSTDPKTLNLAHDLQSYWKTDPAR